VFDPSTRTVVPTAVISGIRDQVQKACVTPCRDGLSRSVDCACYAEYAARYWLRLGAFPPGITDHTDLKVQFSSPVEAEAVAKFIANPELARIRGWSSVIVGPPRSGRTSLGTWLAKRAMTWEIVYKYTNTTRAVYFTARDYAFWLRKVDDFKRTQAELEYYEGALLSSVVVWDDIDPAFANETKFVADIKKRLSSGLPTHLVFSQDPTLYTGSLLAQLIGLTTRSGEIQTTASLVMPITLVGEIMTQTGWV